MNTDKTRTNSVLSVLIGVIRGSFVLPNRINRLAIPIPRRCVARAEAVWAFVGIVLIWAGFVVLAEVKFPWWYDREYEVRHELLDERVAEHPERPLLAVIGSSRIG